MVKIPGWFWTVLWLVCGLNLVSTGIDGNPVMDGIIQQGNVRFTLITPECIRMEYAEGGAFVDQPTLLAENRTVRWTDFRSTRSGDTLWIETSHYRLVHRDNGMPFDAENLRIYIRRKGGEIIWTPGMPNPGNLGGTIQTLDAVHGPIGLGQGVLSRDGWFCLDDSGTPLLTDEWVMERPKSSLIDWYLFVYDDDYRAALRALTAIGGEIPLPRRYLLGSWYSRYWPYASQDYRELVRDYHQYGFPLDVLVLDMDWHKDGWTGWSWNRALLPDAEQLLTELKNQDLYVTLNLHPADGVNPHEDSYPAFMRAMGVDPLVHPDSIIPFDGSDYEYMKNLFEVVHRPLEDAGVDFWWLDWQQSDQSLSMSSLRNLPWLNRNYFRHSRTHGRRGASFSRWGGWGDHKHPIHFSGDAASNWEMLDFEIPFTATAGNVGCFFWSHDIGGHFGQLNPELNTRWVQFGAVSPVLRLHSTRDPAMDKRPWLTDSLYCNAMRIAFHLRAELLPYLYTSTWESCRNSYPLITPLYLEYPQDEQAYHNPQAYLFGPAFLTAPITSPGFGPTKLASQRVWFPPGRWIDWFTMQAYSGSAHPVSVWADINRFPLFVKAGVPIPIQPFSERPASSIPNHLILRVFPTLSDQIDSSVLYEDDGVSDDYQHKAYAITRLRYTRLGDCYTLEISPTQGEFQGQRLVRDYTFELPLTEQAINAMSNDQHVESHYDPIHGINRVRLSNVSIRQSYTIKITAKTRNDSLAENQCRFNDLGGLIGRRDAPITPTDVIRHYQTAEMDISEFSPLISFLAGITMQRIEDKLLIIRSQSSITDDYFNVEIRDHIGKDTIRVLSRYLRIGKGNSIEIPLPESDQALFPLPFRRIATIGLDMENHHYQYHRLIEDRACFLDRWDVMGPFDYDPHQPIDQVIYPPEQVEKGNPISSCVLDNGSIIKWISVESDRDHLIALHRLYPRRSAIAYAAIVLESELDQPVEFGVCSDDGIEVWLNGEKIHSHHVFRSVQHPPERVTATLVAGRNTLLIKISQGDGDWGFKVSLQAHHPLKQIRIGK